MDRHEGESTARVGLPVVLLLAILVLAACTDGDETAIAWSDDPCGLAPPQAVAAAFGVDPVLVGDAPDGECRYEIGDTLLRLTVLSDGDSCDAVIRTYEAIGTRVTAPPDARRGVLITEPEGDILVCDEEATYVMSASGRTDRLLELTVTLPSDRSD